MANVISIQSQRRQMQALTLLNQESSPSAERGRERDTGKLAEISIVKLGTFSHKPLRSWI